MKNYYDGFMKSASMCKEAMQFSKMINVLKYLSGRRLRGQNGLVDAIRPVSNLTKTMAGQPLIRGDASARGVLPALFNSAISGAKKLPEFSGLNELQISDILKRRLRSVGLDMDAIKSGIQDDWVKRNFPGRVYVNRTPAYLRNKPEMDTRRAQKYIDNIISTGPTK